MVGQGVLRECLLAPDVTKVVAVGRSATGQRHDKLTDLVIPDLFDFASPDAGLTGYDACFFCLGVSAAGMSEERYSRLTYDLTLSIAKVLAALNPGMTFIYVSGQGTDSTERGRIMWARVKGRTENALMRLPFKGVYNFRPSLMKPVPGQKHIKTAFRATLVLYPVASLFFPSMPLRDVARAMINAVRFGAPKQVLEVADMKALAAK